MKKILILILLFIFPANAEWIEVTEKHKHLGNFSVNESCNIAIEKAQKKLLEKLWELKYPPMLSLNVLK